MKAYFFEVELATGKAVFEIVVRMFKIGKATGSRRTHFDKGGGESGAGSAMFWVLNGGMVLAKDHPESRVNNSIAQAQMGMVNKSA